MRLLGWIVGVPVALAAIAFAVANRGVVAVDFFPLPLSFEAPVFAVAFVFLVLGFVVGGLAAWASGGRARRRARELARDLAAAGRDLDLLRNRLAKLEGEPPAAPALAAPRNEES